MELPGLIWIPWDADVTRDSLICCATTLFLRASILKCTHCHLTRQKDPVGSILYTLEAAPLIAQGAAWCPLRKPRDCPLLSPLLGHFFLLHKCAFTLVLCLLDAPPTASPPGRSFRPWMQSISSYWLDKHVPMGVNPMGDVQLSAAHRSNRSSLEDTLGNWEFLSQTLRAAGVWSDL